MNSLFAIATLGAVTAAINLSESVIPPTTGPATGPPPGSWPLTVRASTYEVYSELCGRVAYTTEPGAPAPVATPDGLVTVGDQVFMPEFDCAHYPDPPAPTETIPV